MITYLKGILITKNENSPTGANLTIEVNNIGYLVQTNNRVINNLPPEGQIVTVYTTLIHKEDSMTLCGFETREDRDLFNILISVSGIGSRVALHLLGELNANELASAVIASDDKALSRTKGIGPKIAKRIILELKDKMTSWRESTPITSIRKSDTPKSDISYTETESVLLSLGYTKDETEKSLAFALSQTEEHDNSEELLRLALGWLARQ